LAVTAFALHNIQYRLAQYYLDKLRAIEAAYLHGFVHSTHALSRFDQEWSQIKQWGDWAVAHASKDETTAVLCMAFPQAGANVLILRQPPQERLIWLQAGLSAARQHHDPHAAMVLLYLLARAYSSLRSLANAQDAAQQALTLARRIGDKLYQSRILITLGNIHYTEDEYDQSHQANQQALTLATALDAKQEMGAALNGLGNVALSHSDDQRAYDYYLQYLDIAEGLGRPHNICQALRNLSLVSM
jgi:tetratricopeptide (TPR) repeat protein